MTGGFWVLSHFSKYVPRGSRALTLERTSATPRNIFSLSFVSETATSKNYAVQLMNDRQDVVTVTIEFGGYTTTLTLPPVSMATALFNVTRQA